MEGSDADPVTGVQRVPSGALDGTSPAEGPAAAAAIDLDRELDRLLRERRAPRLVFQPIVDLQRGLTVGYEVLSRFAGPPSITPDLWFAAAYRAGRGSELEALVIEQALAARAQLPANCFLSLNVAPQAMLDDAVRGLLHAQPLSRVVLELTEHDAVADYDVLAQVIGEARALGAFVAVDDAGAGYASLQHILALRPDFVKLDRQLIAGLQHDEAKAALVEMFGGFTSRIDAWLLAEGIEEHAELARLSQLGVPLGQGYFLGKPAPHMGPLAPEVMRSLRAPDVGSEARQVVISLAEAQPTHRAGVTDAELLQSLHEIASSTCLALLDDCARPLELAVRVGSRELERRRPMCVLDTTPVREALARALTREAFCRFDPLVCCDELGRYRGLVRLERLVEAALTRCATPP